MRSYRTSESCRSKLRIPGNRENQPGATMYLRSMPVAAGGEEVKAAYHSHTADAARRDGCSMALRKVPGSALATISTGDPAFRFVGSGPDGQWIEELNESFVSRKVADCKSLFDQIKVVARQKPKQQGTPGLGTPGGYAEQ